MQGLEYENEFKKPDCRRRRLTSFDVPQVAVRVPLKDALCTLSHSKVEATVLLVVYPIRLPLLGIFLSRSIYIFSFDSSF